jgi:hypothetical protein
MHMPQIFMKVHSIFNAGAITRIQLEEFEDLVATLIVYTEHYELINC